MVATRAQPFPVLKDTLDPTCPQLEAGKRKAEEQIAKLEQLNKICLGGGTVAVMMLLVCSCGDVCHGVGLQQ